MKKKILVTKNLLKETEGRVQKLFDVKLNKEEKPYTTEDIIELSKDCDGILSFSSDKIDSAAINKLSDKVKLILQIHDELVFDLPTCELNILAGLVKEQMENVMKLEVPIKVDMKKGKNWLEMSVFSGGQG